MPGLLFFVVLMVGRSMLAVMAHLAVRGVVTDLLQLEKVMVSHPRHPDTQELVVFTDII